MNLHSYAALYPPQPISCPFLPCTFPLLDTMLILLRWRGEQHSMWVDFSILFLWRRQLRVWFRCSRRRNRRGRGRLLLRGIRACCYRVVFENWICCEYVWSVKGTPKYYPFIFMLVIDSIPLPLMRSPCHFLNRWCKADDSWLGPLSLAPAPESLFASGLSLLRKTCSINNIYLASFLINSHL